MNIEMLKVRAEIVRTIRAFFDGQGFVEVETPVRIAAPAPEEHIDCPSVAGGGFLRASPELQMKKLLAAGMERIYQIGPCFREGEKGSRHHPEFTMIEWYRKDATYAEIRQDLESLFRRLYSGFAASGDPAKILPAVTMRSLRVRDAYLQYAGWDPWAEYDQDRFDYDMATVIEPKLKEEGGGVFLTDYPPQAASLARIARPEDAAAGAYAERWEFYWQGMELANCFTELCDAEEQRARFVAAKANRSKLGEADYPLDEEFLQQVGNIGAAAGVALGVDRLIMAITGAVDIGEVMNRE